MPISTDYAPTGQITQQLDGYIEGAPQVYFGGVPKYSPDGDGFYWNITPTLAKPVFRLGCFMDFKLADNVQLSEVRCDTLGVVASIQKRSYLEVSFTLESLLPLSFLSPIFARGGTVVTNPTEHTEKMGIGDINNSTFFMLYFAKVYDPDRGDYVSFTGHKAQFVDAQELSMPYGQTWTLGVKMRMYADFNKPINQWFATVIRYSPQNL